jgi:hypothetical protein
MDIQVLRALAERMAELASRDENREKAAPWSRLTDLDKLGDPVVSVGTEARERHRLEAEAVFGSILDVVPGGICFAARVIDEWVALWGMGQFTWTWSRTPDGRTRRWACEDRGRGRTRWAPRSRGSAPTSPPTRSSSNADG